MREERCGRQMVRDLYIMCLMNVTESHVFLLSLSRAIPAL